MSITPTLFTFGNARTNRRVDQGPTLHGWEFRVSAVAEESEDGTPSGQAKTEG